MWDQLRNLLKVMAMESWDRAAAALAKVSREGEIRHYLQDHMEGSVLKHIAGEEEIKPAACFTSF